MVTACVAALPPVARAAALAELGVADEPVIEALTAVLDGKKLPEPDRAWAAATLIQS